jgi:hypothetical protein
MLGKQHEGNGGQDLENGDLLAGIGLGDPAQCVGKTASSTSLPPPLDADAVALVPIDQMRRGVDVDAVAAGFKQGPAKRQRTTLAVGAGHMNDGRQLQSCGLPSASRSRVMRSSDRSKPFG